MAFQEKVKIREVTNYLRKHRLVKTIEFERVYGTGIFKVAFVDGITENWYTSNNITRNHHYDHIMPNDAWVKNKPIKTYREFETNPLRNDYEKLQSYFMISKRDIKQAGFCEVRLKIHELVTELMKEGWIPIKYPDASLKRDFEHVKAIAGAWEGTHRIAPYRGNKKYGHLLMMHFNDISDIKYEHRPTLREAWRAVPLYKAVNEMTYAGRDITRASLVRNMTTTIEGRAQAGTRLPLIEAWKTLFDKLKLSAVYDLEPNYGEKAIAATACGTKYKALVPSNTELLKFVGAKEGQADTTILTCLNILSDDELQRRINALSTPKAIAIVTKEQWRKLDCIQQYEIRLDPAIIGHILHMACYFKSKKEV
jgi:hypothetical protein